MLDAFLQLACPVGQGLEFGLGEGEFLVRLLVLQFLDLGADVSARVEAPALGFDLGSGCHLAKSGHVGVAAVRETIREQALGGVIGFRLLARYSRTMLASISICSSVKSRWARSTRLKIWRASIMSTRPRTPPSLEEPCWAELEDEGFGAFREEGCERRMRISSPGDYLLADAGEAPSLEVQGQALGQWVVDAFQDVPAIVARHDPGDLS